MSEGTLEKVAACPFCRAKCETVRTGWVVCSCGYSSMRTGTVESAVRLHNRVAQAVDAVRTGGGGDVGE